ncbi:hypothetical protein [Emticicia agri]|nr:hypothetical protein [Emticicia agri]
MLKFGMRITIFSWVIACLLISCGSNQSKEAQKDKQEDFEIFWQKFQYDKDFQKSRVKFPLLSKYYGVDDEYHEETTKKSEWEYRDFNIEGLIKTLNKESPTRTIMALMIEDTGVYVEYIFELRNKKWFLIETVDQST